MSTTTPLTDAINALTAYCNEVDGGSDTNLSDAVATLASGYGGDGWTTEGFANRSEPNGAITISGTSVAEFAFYGCRGITAVSAPNCVTYRQNAFRDCTSLSSISLEDVTTMESQAFRNTALSTVVMKAITSISGQYVFGYCTSLTSADFSLITRLGQAMFEQSTNFDTLVIRTGSVATIDSTNVFNATCFKSGGTGGTLYVPSSLISSYEANSNWSTILSRENNSIVAIEGSIYETQYVDGTAITA